MFYSCAFSDFVCCSHKTVLNVLLQTTSVAKNIPCSCCFVVPLCSPLQPLLESPLLDNALVIYTNTVVAHTCFLSFCLHRIYFSPTKMYSFLTNVQYIHQNIYFPARYTMCRKMYIYMEMYNWSTMNYNIPTIFPPKCAIFTLNLKILKGTDFCFCSTSTVCGARDLYQVCCRVYIIK